MTGSIGDVEHGTAGNRPIARGDCEWTSPIPGGLATVVSPAQDAQMRRIKMRPSDQWGRVNQNGSGWRG